MFLNMYIVNKKIVVLLKNNQLLLIKYNEQY